MGILTTILQQLMSPQGVEQSVPQQNCPTAANVMLTSANFDLPPVRRSHRTRKPPTWMHDFVTQACASQPPAIDQVDTALGNVVSTVQLSESGKALLASIENTSDPVTFFQVVQDPKWCQAMDAELRALEDNGTWHLSTLPPGKRLLVVNGYIKPNLSQMVVWISARLG